MEKETDAEFANGLSIEEMETAAKAIDNPTDENAELLYMASVKTFNKNKLKFCTDGFLYTDGSLTAIIYFQYLPL